MPYDDYSDSDESDVEEVQTSVLLGLPDGPIISPADLSKPRISRIGGLPVHTSSHPTAFCVFSNIDSSLQSPSTWLYKGVPKWDPQTTFKFHTVPVVF